MKRSLVLFLPVAVIISCDSQKQTNDEYKCPCESIGLKAKWADSAKVSCYLIPVEKNSSQPQKETYLLAVAVAHSLNKATQDPLLYLHGGPGIATLENMPRYLKSAKWKMLREKNDVVFFDFRGTGFSEPQLCKDLQDSLQVISRIKPPHSEEIAKTVLLYKNCREKLEKDKIDISSFSSFQFAADVEGLRKALQIKKWNVYGVSNGTNIALNLLRSFPQPLKGVILDSPFPPNSPYLDFVRSFDTCFKVLEKYIAADQLASSKFSSLRKDFVRAVDRLNKRPVPLPLKMKADTNINIYNFDGRDFARSVSNAMLNPKSIPLVPLGITEIANGNDSVLVKWALLFNDPNKFGAYAAAQSMSIFCYEDLPRLERNVEEIIMTNYREFSALYTPGLDEAICKEFRPQVADKKIFQPVVSDVPVLILAGEFDPVTPPLFGEVTARTLSNSTFITVPSASHAAMFADDCLMKIATDFISSPDKKLSVECVEKRPRIKFVTGGLLEELKKL